MQGCFVSPLKYQDYQGGYTHSATHSSVTPGPRFGMKIPHNQIVRNVGNCRFDPLSQGSKSVLLAEKTFLPLRNAQTSHFAIYKHSCLQNVLWLQIVSSTPKYLKIKGYFLGNCMDSELFCKYFAWALLLFTCVSPSHAPLSIEPICPPPITYENSFESNLNVVSILLG